MGRSQTFIAGLTLLASAATGCGGKWTDDRNANGSAGAGNAGAFATGGSFVGGAGAPGGAGGPADDLGVWLIPTNGWVDGESNALMIQGAMFSHADDWSVLQMTSDFTGTNACIKGSTVAPSAYCRQMHCCHPTACSGSMWGVAISLNFNQWMDVITMMPGVPSAYNGSALKGFAFELNGPNLPAPQSLAVQIESYDAVYDSRPTKALVLGVNTVLFDELSLPLAERARLIRISWLVVTNYENEVPYDFCVSNVRALYR